MNRQRRWAYSALARLRHLLGEACAWCSSPASLEFDCIDPQGDDHHRKEPNRRACFYRRQFKAGNLQLLCSSCHSRKTRAQTDADNAYNNLARAFRPTSRHRKTQPIGIDGNPIDY